MKAERDTEKISRRAALGRLALAGGAALTAPALSIRRVAAAGRSEGVREIYRGIRGTTIWMNLDTAPFPCKGSPYRDSTVIAFVPHRFRVRSDMHVDTVMHFHGWRDTADAAMKRHQLREQLYESKQNAILVIPQGPVNVEDSSGGKLERKGGMVDLLSDVRRTLQTRRVAKALGRAHIPSAARIGKLLLSAHSAGYKVTAACLARGGFNVNEVFLFDALYGDVDAFRDWVAERRSSEGDERHKLVSYYRGHATAVANRQLMAELDKLHISYVNEQEEGRLSRRQLTLARAVFINSGTGHQATVYRHNNLRDCLYASCLERYVASDWFDRAGKPRRVDRRVVEPR